MAPHVDYNVVTSDGVTIKTASAALEKASYFRFLFDTDCEENETGTIHIQHRVEDFSLIHNMLLYETGDIVEGYKEIEEIKRVLLLKNMKYYGIDQQYISIVQGWGRQCKCPAYKLICLIAKKAVAAGDITYEDVVACGNAEILATDAMSKTVNEKGETPFMFAVESGDTELVKEIVSSGADINARDSDGVPVLIKVIRSRNEEMARILIKQGADVNVSESNVTPIAVAVATNQLNVVKYLTAADADLSAGEHPYICQAISFNNYNMLRTLIMAGADYECCDQYGVSPIRCALQTSAPTDVIQEFIDCGVDVTSADILIDAIESGNTASIELLVKEGAKVTSKALGLYIRELQSDNYDTLDLLLEHSGEKIKHEKNSVLSIAIDGQKLSVVKKLLNNNFAFDANAHRCSLKRNIQFSSKVVELIVNEEVSVIGDSLPGLSSLLFFSAKKEELNLFSMLLSIERVPLVNNDVQLVNFLLKIPLLSIEYLEAVFKIRPQPVTTLMLLTASGVRNISNLNIILSNCDNVSELVNIPINDNTCLLEAIRTGNTEAVYKLVDCGADLTYNTTLEPGEEKLCSEKIKRTAVYIAASHSSMPILKYILSFHDQELKNKRNIENQLLPIPKEVLVSALEIAVEKSSYKMVIELLQFNIDIKTDSPNLLAKASHPRIVDKLVFCGACVKSTSGHGRTPLLQAFQRGDKSAMTSLLNAGADPNEQLPKGWSLIHLATLRGVAYVDILIKAGVNTEVVYKNQTPLHMAIKRNSLPVTKLLIEAGANFDVVCDDETPLNMAIKHKDRIIMKELIQAGANAVSGSKNGAYISHPLVRLIEEDDSESVALVIAAGADVNATVSPQYESPLMFACRTCNPKIIRCLIDAGSDVNLLRPNGLTALFIAVSCSQVSLEIVQMLVDAGAKTTVKAENNSLVHTAALFCSDEIMACLRKGK